ncbi:unnamed protein product [Arabis nemorensis]|uniref:BED-type domain-containing protein n=1 Tax=Arabis nemorensis TaxID=586526 RepID=A0A565AZ25_9BRAS|nr:unnamed protein product [Arabis nemorensis]
MDTEDNDVYDVEPDEFSEEDTPSQKKKTKTGGKAKPKKRRFVSKVWKHFDLNGKNTDGQETTKCKHCAAILVVEKNHGTRM